MLASVLDSQPFPSTSDSGLHQSYILGLYNIARCRALGTIDSGTLLSRPTDLSVTVALATYARQFGRASGGGTAAATFEDTNAVLMHALFISCCVNTDALMRVAGSEGSESAIAVINDLIRGWYGTRASRRAVLHAGQILRIALEGNSVAIPPPHFLTTVHTAVLLLLVYSLGAEREARLLGGSTNAPVINLVTMLDSVALGQCGLQEEAEPTEMTEAARFVLHGQQQHRFAHILHRA